MTEAQPLTVSLDFVRLGDQVQITWGSELFDARKTAFHAPYTDHELPAVIKALDQLQAWRHHFSDTEQEALKRHGLWRNETVEPRADRLVGQAIYAALGTAGAGELDYLTSTAIRGERSINYVLRFPIDCTDLAALPWELLRSPRGNVLMRPGGTDSVERYIVLGLPPQPPLPSDERPHVLLLLSHFAINSDDRAVELQRFERLRDSGVLTFDSLSPVTWDHLVDYMRTTQRPPHIVHYAGHGAYKDQEGWLLFDGSGQRLARISAEHFSSVIGRARLAVILACQSAMVAEGELLTGVAPALSQAVAAVVAMQLTVHTAEAHRFADVFYEELLTKGESLQSAVSRGRQALYGADPSRASWYIPTLYIRTAQSEIVPRKQPARFIVRKRPPRPTVDPIEIDGLRLELIAEAAEGQWRLEVTNLSDSNRESVVVTVTGALRGLSVKPTQMNVPRVLARGAAVPVPITITVGALTDEVRIPISLVYRISGTNQGGRGSAAFIVRPARKG